MRVMIIAEVGSNYDGDLNTAKEYIRKAHESGADIIKFQTIRKKNLIAPLVSEKGKLKDNPVFSNFANLELSDKWHYELKEEADKVGIEFLSTPFYEKAVDLLENVGVHRYKIASGDITFIPLLEKVGKTGKPVILSTGASSLSDVKFAVNILKENGTKDISLLHCIASYPPQWEEMNIKAITTLSDIFQCPVGISDHSPGNLVPVASVALGASVVEKHVTIDRRLPGPDHSFAMTFEEFTDMVDQIRVLEIAIGNGEKKPSDSEAERQYRMRRGIYDSVTQKPVEGENGVWLRPDYRLIK
jgi:N,N'-diacetyllegionaminate synthase